MTLNIPQSMLVEMNKGEDAFTSHFALKSIEMPAKVQTRTINSQGKTTAKKTTNDFWKNKKYTRQN